RRQAPDRAGRVRGGSHDHPARPRGCAGGGTPDQRCAHGGGCGPDGAAVMERRRPAGRPSDSGAEKQPGGIVPTLALGYAPSMTNSTTLLRSLFVAAALIWFHTMAVAASAPDLRGLERNPHWL